jgi:hypothetical protein
MSSYSSVASPYVRVAFPNGMMASLHPLRALGEALLKERLAFPNEAMAFPNIYPPFPNKPMGSVCHGGHGEEQHHRRYSDGYSKNQSDTSHQEELLYSGKGDQPHLLDSGHL